MAANISRALFTALGAAGSYGAYHQYKLTQELSKPIQRKFMEEILFTPTSKKGLLAATTIGALATVFYLWAGKADEPQEPALLPVMTSPVKEESLIQGSPLTQRPTPPCQGYVAIKKMVNDKEQLEIIGCCLRTAYGIWVPAHVLGARPEECFIIGKRMARMAKGGKEEFYYPQVSLQSYFSQLSEQITFGAEIMCVPLSDAHLSSLGLSIGQMSNLNKKMTVTITGPGGDSSMGDLVPGETMGMVRYYGSTQAGFSGAPYMYNGKVIGVHLHGGAGGNGGQEIFYLNQVYKIEKGIMDESLVASTSGAKLMEKAFKNKEEVKWEDHGNHVVFRDTSGFYHRCDKNAFYELRDRYQYQSYADEEDWETESDYSADYQRGNPDEYDKYHKRGKYSEDSKRYRPESKREQSSFLGKSRRGSKNFRQLARTQSEQTRLDEIVECLKEQSDTLKAMKNGLKPKQWKPRIPHPKAPSTASPSNSGEGQKS